MKIIEEIAGLFGWKKYYEVLRMNRHIDGGVTGFYHHIGWAETVEQAHREIMNDGGLHWVVYSPTWKLIKRGKP